MGLTAHGNLFLLLNKKIIDFEFDRDKLNLYENYLQY